MVGECVCVQLFPEMEIHMVLYSVYFANMCKIWESNTALEEMCTWQFAHGFVPGVFLAEVALWCIKEVN